MMQDISIWYAAGLMAAFFVGFFIRYVSDYLDFRLNRKPPRYDEKKKEE